MVKLGIDPILAWDYTPCEIALLCEQVGEKRKNSIDELLFLAWHTEAFARQKRLPRLETLLKDARSNKTSRSDAILKKMAKEKGVIIK